MCNINIRGYTKNQNMTVKKGPMTFAECFILKRMPIMHFDLTEFLEA